MELNIEKFTPKKAELTLLVEQSKGLLLPDPFDMEQKKKIKEARIGLKNARVEITKNGKALREDALAFQKAVIAKEKEFVAIIEPEEERLAGLEAEAEKAVERAARKELLPSRISRIQGIDPNIMFSSDSLLEMDGSAFEGYCNQLVAEKNAAESARLAAKQKEIDEANADLQRKKDIAEAEERGRKEAAERAQRETKEKEELEARKKKEAEEEAERERHEKEAREKAEKERLERDKKYQSFLVKHGYTEATKHEFYLAKTDTQVSLYKLAGTLKLTD